MKQRPILFKAKMVRAILDGTKTQTRRLVKPQPDEDGLAFLLHGGRWQDTSGVDYKCPYGQVGDQLWVRETFDKRAWTSKFPDNAYKATLKSPLGMIGDKWTPSIFMPRWASRIQLEITNVRVERLNDISEADAKAEGADSLNADNVTEQDKALLDFPLYEIGKPYRNGYAFLWECINGAGSWDENPWVWCITFKVINGVK